jgi:cell division protein FtsN
MYRYLLMIAGIVFLFNCAGTQNSKQSDDKLNKAIAESEKNKNEKIDFLKDEKLPNEEYVPADSADDLSAVDSGYTEIPPTINAKYRVQIFSGSAANAQKLYHQYTSQQNATDAYVLYDSESAFWKVWIGNYMTKPEADSAKAKLIELGFTGAWVKEMKQTAVVTSSSQELFWIQLGSFQKESSAQQLFQKVTDQVNDQVIIKTAGTSYKIWIGGFSDRAKADDLKAKLIQLGYQGIFVVQGME